MKHCKTRVKLYYAWQVHVKCVALVLAINEALMKEIHTTSQTEFDTDFGITWCVMSAQNRSRIVSKPLKTLLKNANVPWT